MSSSDAATYVFASTTRDHPIHLWDAYTDQQRCTYRAYDAMGEITAALSISFNCLGTKIYAGYNKILRIFDVHRPGRDFAQHSLLKRNDGPTGLVSSISFSPAHNGMLAIGTYSQTTAIYAEGNMELLYGLHGQLGGVTQDKWKTLVHTATFAPQQRRGEPVPQELLDRVLLAQNYWSQQQAKF